MFQIKSIAIEICCSKLMAQRKFHLRKQRKQKKTDHGSQKTHYFQKAYKSVK